MSISIALKSRSVFAKIRLIGTQPMVRYHCDGQALLTLPGNTLLTSEEWLATHGLEPLKLTFYQAFRSLAFGASKPHQVMGAQFNSMRQASHCRGYSSIVTRSQVRWGDGSLKTVHLDVKTLLGYRKSVGDILTLYNDRIRWCLCNDDLLTRLALQVVRDRAKKILWQCC